MLRPDFLFASGKGVRSGCFQSLNTAVGEDIHSRPEFRIDLDRVDFAGDNDLLRIRQTIQVAAIDKFKASDSDAE